MIGVVVAAVIIVVIAIVLAVILGVPSIKKNVFPHRDRANFSAKS